MTPSIQQIALLMAELFCLSGVIFVLFKGRTRFGLLPLAALIGSIQYLQTVLASTLYIRFSEELLISPGSGILFPATLVAVLLLYHQDGVPKARSLMLGIVVSNVTLTLLSYFSFLHIQVGNVENLLTVPEVFFQINPRVFLAGTSVLILDVLAVAIVYEIVSSHLQRLSALVRISLVLVLVLAFDSITFSTLAFAGHPAFSEILASHLLSKTVAGLFYGLVLFGLLNRTDSETPSVGVGVGTGAWAILTYRERFEILRKQKKAQEQAFEKERTESREALSAAEWRYRMLFETTTDGLLVLDASNDIIVGLNPALERLSGYSQGELIGRPLDETGLFENLAETPESAISEGWESKLLRRDADALDIEIKLVRFVSGALHTLVVVIRDISERKAAELALQQSHDGQLRESEARYRDLFENSHDLIQAVRTDGSFVFVNGSWKRTLGYSDEEVTELRLLEIVSPESRATFGEFLSRLGEERSGGLVETEFLAKDGRSILLEGNVECGKTDGLIRGIFRDVTERKALERLKSRFIETVSHELRTPLASIYGSLDLVASGKLAALPDSVERFIGIALRNSQRLSWLINEILDLQKIESGHLQLDLKSCELGAMVEQAIEDNQAYADRYGVRLETLNTSQQRTALVDRRWLLQVMTNLISNAVKHSPEHAVVLISIEEQKGHVRVSVRDHGPGIPAEFHDQVFQPFSQVQLDKKPEEGSSGLGLSIAKMLIERMHGELNFISFGQDMGSGQEMGTTFYFDLPLHQPEARESSPGAQA